MKNNILGDNNFNLDVETLKRLQKIPLDQKVNISLQRIDKFINGMKENVYVSFSGGKDSTVLLHLVRQINPNIKAVFVDTGLEYPEIRDFVKTVDNVEWLKPKYTFKEVIDKYGYPLPSKDVAQKIEEVKHTKSTKLLNKRLYGTDKGNIGKIPEKWKFLIDAPFECSKKCCNYLKLNPSKRYEKENNVFPFIGIMASDSVNRYNTIIENGCTVFDGNRPHSYPLFHWNEEDIWQYIKEKNIPYSKIYDMGYDRTGCMFCMFGYWHPSNKNNRFTRMKETHPKQYNYCMNKLGLKDIINYVDDHLNNEYDSTCFFPETYRKIE